MTRVQVKATSPAQTNATTRKLDRVARAGLQNVIKDINTTGLTSAQIDALFVGASTVTDVPNGIQIIDSVNGLQLTRIAGVWRPSWVTPTLINSWSNFGSGYETAAYLKDILGFVHLKGVITGGASTSVAFVLPAGYRPGAMGIYATGPGANVLSCVTITAGGSVEPTLIGSSGAVPSMSGITFLAEN